MKKLISLFIVAAMLAAVLVLATGCGKKTRSLADIKASGKLVVYTEAGFAPFEFVSGGKVVGVDVAICGEIAKAIGVELEIKDVNFDTILGAIKSGKCDMGAAGITITDERKEEVDFSAPYTTSKQYIVVAADNTTVSTLGTMAGLKIGVQQGTTSDFIISDAIDGTEDDDGKHVKGELEGTGATVSGYKSPNDVVPLLLSGKIDVLVTDKLPAEMIAKNNADTLKCFELFYDDGTATDESYGVAVAKGNAELLAVIDTVIAQLIADGKIDEYIVYYSNEVTADE
ncbi:MAG: transporter substrate-binding domain-containing protein [Clostridia bacterium]|nr:transporter substrate-binding domain-containing protein [Clostridia bacterium]